eukprot:7376419-Prymnesium_polylepis.2
MTRLEAHHRGHHQPRQVVKELLGEHVQPSVPAGLLRAPQSGDHQRGTDGRQRQLTKCRGGHTDGGAPQQDIAAHEDEEPHRHPQRRVAPGESAQVESLATRERGERDRPTQHHQPQVDVVGRDEVGAAADDGEKERSHCLDGIVEIFHDDDEQHQVELWRRRNRGTPQGALGILPDQHPADALVERAG